MKRLNNHGQVLTVFVLLLPFFFVLLAFVLDYGYLAIQKKQIDDTVEEILIYASENKDHRSLKEEVETLLEKNIEQTFRKNVVITDTSITITITVSLNGNFEKINSNQYQIEKVKMFS